MYSKIVSKIKKKIQKVNFISIMFDETRDIANHEQGTFFIWIVDEDFKIHEIFLGIYQCAKLYKR